MGLSRLNELLSQYTKDKAGTRRKHMIKESASDKMDRTATYTVGHNTWNTSGILHLHYMREEQKASPNRCC